MKVDDIVLTSMLNILDIHDMHIYTHVGFHVSNLTQSRINKLGGAKQKIKRGRGWGVGICRHPSLYMYVCVSSASSPMNAIYVRKMIK